MISLGYDNLSTVLPGLLQDQATRPACYPAPAPSRYHAVADLHSFLPPGRAMESDVSYDHTVDDDLMHPPGRQLSNRVPHGLVRRERHGNRIKGVRQRIFRMPGRRV